MAVVNLGCPQCHVSGWHSSQVLAEPSIWGVGCYIAPMSLATVLAGRLIGKRRNCRTRFHHRTDPLGYY